jgi:hypothetical protein
LVKAALRPWESKNKLCSSVGARSHCGRAEKMGGVFAAFFGKYNLQKPVHFLISLFSHSVTN